MSKGSFPVDSEACLMGRDAQWAVWAEALDQSGEGRSSQRTFGGESVRHLG